MIKICTKTSPSYLLLATLLLSSGCKEFYDEEFLEDQASLEESQSSNFEATLSSTDPNLTTLTGQGQVQIIEGEVVVNLNLQGIPQNITQVHYSVINSACNLLNISVPNEAGTTRSYTVSENLSTAAFQVDLQSSGAANSNGDLNLQGKSFIVKAIPNFSGLPNPAGTNAVTIACGELVAAEVDTTESDDENTTDEDTTGTETGTGTDTGTDTGTGTGGTVGGSGTGFPPTTPTTDPFGRPTGTDPFGRPTNTGF